MCLPEIIKQLFCLAFTGKFKNSIRSVNKLIRAESSWSTRLQINPTKFLGYDKDIEGNLVINPKQAEIVRRIFKEYLDGKGANRIARDLEREKVPI